VDLRRFVPGPKPPDLVDRLGLSGAPVFGSVGTMSNWYLREDTLRYLAALTRTFDRARILIVTRDDHATLRRDAEAAGIAPDRLSLTRADFADMPRLIRLFDAGVFFIRPALSKRGSAATKLAEFLACGVPVVINDGVGDSGGIVREGRVGVVLPAMDPQSVAQSLPEVRRVLDDGSMAERCQRVATERFDLEQAVEKYRTLYGRL
jgi:glycosyltransferase involved in cell wall biosynthesis